MANPAGPPYRPLPDAEAEQEYRDSCAHHVVEPISRTQAVKCSNFAGANMVRIMRVHPPGLFETAKAVIVQSANRDRLLADAFRADDYVQRSADALYMSQLFEYLYHEAWTARYRVEWTPVVRARVPPVNRQLLEEYRTRLINSITQWDRYAKARRGLDEVQREERLGVLNGLMAHRRQALDDWRDSTGIQDEWVALSACTNRDIHHAGSPGVGETLSLVYLNQANSWHHILNQQDRILYMDQVNYYGQRMRGRQQRVALGTVDDMVYDRWMEALQLMARLLGVPGNVQEWPNAQYVVPPKLPKLAAAPTAAFGSAAAAEAAANAANVAAAAAVQNVPGDDDDNDQNVPMAGDDNQNAPAAGGAMNPIDEQQIQQGELIGGGQHADQHHYQQQQQQPPVTIEQFLAQEEPHIANAPPLPVSHFLPLHINAQLLQTYNVVMIPLGVYGNPNVDYRRRVIRHLRELRDGLAGAAYLVFFQAIPPNAQSRTDQGIRVDNAITEWQNYHFNQFQELQQIWAAAAAPGV